MPGFGLKIARLFTHLGGRLLSAQELATLIMAKELSYADFDFPQSFFVYI